MPAGRPTDYTDLSYIYSLSDPETKEVRYIGKTDIPKQRRSAHRTKQMGNSYRKNWINSLLEKGSFPEFTILQIVDREFWKNAEREWIKKYKDIGHKLTNYDDGGIGATSGGKQRRIHFIKRELSSIYNMLSRNNKVRADRLAIKLRFLYISIPGCPKKWRNIGL